MLPDMTKPRPRRRGRGFVMSGSID